MTKNTREQVREITEQLEAGTKAIYTSENYARFLETMAKFHYYSVNNCILIAMQCPEATRVAGYKKWNEFGRHVKKGEKAIKIIAPCPHKKVVQEVDEDGNVTEKQLAYTTFRVAGVFDLSQTEGEDLPEVCRLLEGDAEGFENMLEALKNISPVGVEFDEIKGGANGFYSHASEKIVIREGMSELQTIKTLIHEVAHALLHGKGGSEENASREEKEVQAESVAFTVCSWLGIDSSDYSFGYIAGWSEGKDLKELTASMDTIRRTAGVIIEGMSWVKQAA